MEQLKFLFEAFVGGFFVFVTEELIQSAKYSLLTVVFSYGIGILTFWISNLRFNRWVTWCLVGSITAFVASVFRVGIVYKGYVSFLAGVNCFATLHLTNVTYLLFALSGCAAGCVIALLQKLKIKHSGIIAIALGVLYHFKVASGWCTTQIPARLVLFAGEFLAPALFICVTYPMAHHLVRSYRRGLRGGEE
jgi:hypothetical protein